jgi:hypothetical protein
LAISIGLATELLAAHRANARWAAMSSRAFRLLGETLFGGGDRAAGHDAHEVGAVFGTAVEIAVQVL